MTAPRLSKNLQKTIHIDYESYIDDQKYVGDFLVKKLTIRELAAMGVRKAQLNAGMHYTPETPGQGVDPETDELNGMVAHLELAVVTAPPWWKLDEIVDHQLLMAVYKEVVSFENSFLKRRLEKLKGATADSSGSNGSQGTPAKPEPARIGGNVVPADVQAALEP